MSEPVASLPAAPVSALTSTAERSLALDAARLQAADAMRTMLLIVGVETMQALVLGVQIAVTNEFYAGKGRGR